MSDVEMESSIDYKCEYCGRITKILYVGHGHPYLCEECYDKIWDFVDE